MSLKDTFKKTRSYRRFHQDYEVAADILTDVVENVRYSASAANLQPLKFIIVNDKKTNDALFRHLKWAAYLKDWDGPEEGERPSAYIVMLGDRGLSRFLDLDCGIALQTILVSLTEKDLGACTFASINRDAIREMFKVPPSLDIVLVIAIGKAKETVVIDDVKDGDIKYWRDERNVHHVPKRKLADMIFKAQ
jgi:nitroreductase